MEMFILTKETAQKKMNPGNAKELSSEKRGNANT
jgi:hypothetical protein